MIDQVYLSHGKNILRECILKLLRSMKNIDKIKIRIGKHKPIERTHKLSRKECKNLIKT